MKTKKRRIVVCAVIVAVLFAFLLSPLFPLVRSLTVMSVYSRQCAKNSIMEKENIELRIPSGKNWYPFVMTYTADAEFTTVSHIPDTKLTILYNFPAFSVEKGCSRLFDESSPYYSSFYGAYLVQTGDGSNYGFSKETGALDTDSISKIAKYDFFSLVLGDFGLTEDEQVFDCSVSSQENGQSFLGYGDWTRIESDITVNGADHRKKGFVTSYLQYGSPNFPVSSDFAPIKMKSIVYARYFKEWNSSVFFYVMSPSEKICNECMQTILSQSTLKSKIS